MTVYAVQLHFEDTIYVEADDEREAKELADTYVYNNEDGAFLPAVRYVGKWEGEGEPRYGVIRRDDV